MKSENTRDLPNCVLFHGCTLYIERKKKKQVLFLSLFDSIFARPSQYCACAIDFLVYRGNGTHTSLAPIRIFTSSRKHKKKLYFFLSVAFVVCRTCDNFQSERSKFDDFFRSVCFFSEKTNEMNFTRSLYVRLFCVLLLLSIHMMCQCKNCVKHCFVWFECVRIGPRDCMRSQRQSKKNLHE